MPQSNDPAGPRKIPLVFFKTAAGAEPVRDWLLDLDADDRKVVGFDLMQVQFAKLPSGRIARVIFCFADGELIALTGFIKKTQRTPQRDIDTALKRKTEYET